MTKVREKATKVKPHSPVNSEYKLKYRMMMRAHLDDAFDKVMFPVS
jgi:hypothetical protein